jgi:hypothetical protein
MKSLITWSLSVFVAWVAAAAVVTTGLYVIRLLVGAIDLSELVGSVAIGLAFSWSILLLLSAVPMLAVALACWRVNPSTRRRTLLVVGTVYFVSQIAFWTLLVWVSPLGDPSRSSSMTGDVFGDVLWYGVSMPIVVGLLMPIPKLRASEESSQATNLPRRMSDD